MMAKRKRSNKWVWAALGLLIVAVVGGGAALMQRLAQMATTQTGDVVTVFVGDLSARATASGQLTPQRQANLALASSGRVAAVNVQVGDAVRAGDVLVQLETSALERAAANAAQALAIQTANLEQLTSGATAAEIAAAQASVASAQANLDSLLAGPSETDLAAAAANVRAAQAQVWAAAAQRDQAQTGAAEADILAAQNSLDAARQQRDSLQEAYENALTCFDTPDGQICPGLGPTEERLRASLAAAEAQLAAAQAQLDALLAGANPDTVNAAQASVGAAQANLEAAQARLALAQQGAAAAQIASAQAQLAQAQASLEVLLAGPSPAQLDMAAAQVEQARIAWQRAQNDVAKATLTAPFDGIVTAVNAAVGETAAGPVVSLMDSDSLEVALRVDEVDLAGLALGQQAQVTFESFPDTPIAAEVAAIAPQNTAGAETGLVTYQVNLRLAQTDLPLRANMTANASLITGSRQDVLLLPNRAIVADRQAGKFYVNKVTPGANGANGEPITEQVEVSIGLRDDENTEIKSGLAAGDQVVIGSALPVSLPFSGGPPGTGGNP